MSYSVHFSIDLRAFSGGERRQVEQTMKQIAEVVASVPLSSPFWSSMKDSVLQIDVAGWRLGYRIDRSANLGRVIEATRLS